MGVRVSFLKAENPTWSLGQLSIQNIIEIGTKLIKKNEQRTKVKWLGFQVFQLKVSNYKSLGLFEFNN